VDEEEAEWKDQTEEEEETEEKMPDEPPEEDKVEDFPYPEKDTKSPSPERVFVVFRLLICTDGANGGQCSNGTLGPRKGMSGDASYGVAVYRKGWKLRRGEYEGKDDVLFPREEYPEDYSPTMEQLEKAITAMELDLLIKGGENRIGLHMEPHPCLAGEKDLQDKYQDITAQLLHGYTAIPHTPEKLKKLRQDVEDGKRIDEVADTLNEAAQRSLIETAKDLNMPDQHSSRMVAASAESQRSTTSQTHRQRTPSTTALQSMHWEREGTPFDPSPPSSGSASAGRSGSEEDGGSGESGDGNRGNSFSKMPVVAKMYVPAARHRANTEVALKTISTAVFTFEGPVTYQHEIRMMEVLRRLFEDIRLAKLNKRKNFSQEEAEKAVVSAHIHSLPPIWDFEGKGDDF